MGALFEKNRLEETVPCVSFAKTDSVSLITGALLGADGLPMSGLDETGAGVE